MEHPNLFPVALRPFLTSSDSLPCKGRLPQSLLLHPISEGMQLYSGARIKWSQGCFISQGSHKVSLGSSRHKGPSNGCVNQNRARRPARNWKVKREQGMARRGTVCQA